MTQLEIISFAERLRTFASVTAGDAIRKYHCYEPSGKGLKPGQRKYFKAALKVASDAYAAASSLNVLFNTFTSQPK
tara:strand:- start:215 stop:442 length:228 start_codon:yes stop_codon:yes gene_type:complete